MGEHRDENAPIVGAVINNENSFHGSSVSAASVQPTGAEITYFEFVKPRKLYKTAFGNPRETIRTGSSPCHQDRARNNETRYAAKHMPKARATLPVNFIEAPLILAGGRTRKGRWYEL